MSTPTVDEVVQATRDNGRRHGYTPPTEDEARQVLHEMRVQISPQVIFFFFWMRTFCRNRTFCNQ